MKPTSWQNFIAVVRIEGVGGGFCGRVTDTRSQSNHQEARLQSQPRLNAEAALRMSQLYDCNSMHL